MGLSFDEGHQQRPEHVFVRFPHANYHAAAGLQSRPICRGKSIDSILVGMCTDNFGCVCFASIQVMIETIQPGSFENFAFSKSTIPTERQVLIPTSLLMRLINTSKLSGSFLGMAHDHRTPCSSGRRHLL